MLKDTSKRLKKKSGTSGGNNKLSMLSAIYQQYRNGERKLGAGLYNCLAWTFLPLAAGPGHHSLSRHATWMESGPKAVPELP